MDADGYPDEDELGKIRHWDGLKDPMGLIRFIKEIWWQPKWGFLLDESGDPIKLELHTAGWSGNEDIIGALQDSGPDFFFFFWQESRRGGHYKFEIPRSVLKAPTA